MLEPVGPVYLQGGCSALPHVGNWHQVRVLSEDRRLRCVAVMIITVAHDPALLPVILMHITLLGVAHTSSPQRMRGCMNVRLINEKKLGSQSTAA
jgi:hypothetical protein